MLTRDQKILIQNRSASLQKEFRELRLEARPIQHYIDTFMRISHSAENCAELLERDLIQLKLEV